MATTIAQKPSWYDALGLSRRWAAIRRWPLIPLFLILMLVVVPAALADVLAPHDPEIGDLSERLIPPFWAGDVEAGEEKGINSYILGTDRSGRDIFSRMMHGARVSLLVSLLAITAGGFVGTTLGLFAGYYGGLIDHFIMRIVDAFLAFPFILLALVLVSIFGSSFGTVVVTIGILLWARFARLARGEALSIRPRDFVMRARASGVL